MDWKSLLLENAPKAAILALAGKTGGMAGASGLLQGGFQADQIHQQQARQAQMDAQQQAFRQAQLDAQMRDDERANQQLYGQQLQHALALIDEAVKQQSETAPTAQAAENAVMQKASTISSLYGLPPDALSGAVAGVAPAVAARDRKRAQEILDKLDRDPRYEGYRSTPEGMAQLDEISVPWTDGKSRKMGELRAMVGAPSQLPTKGKPQIQILDLGNHKKVVDASQLTPGQTFAESPSASGDTGWTIQQVSDPVTNTTKLMRVNSRTGAVEPVNLPGGMQPGGQRQRSLTASQQEDLATMATVQDLSKQLVALGDKTDWKGIGGFGTGSIREFGSKNLGTGTGEEIQLRALIGNIKGTIAKLRGGTSFTPNEQKLLDSYTPGQNETAISIKNKIIGLDAFIETKRKNTMQFAGAEQVTGKAADPLGIR